MDVSADLIELGRNPVAVVASGVKSILDIPKTLEFLVSWIHSREFDKNAEFRFRKLRAFVWHRTRVTVKIFQHFIPENVDQQHRTILPVRWKLPKL